MREDPSKIEEKEVKSSAQDSGSFVYRGVCDTCHWSGPWLKDEVMASSLLSRHRSHREHKTNCASPQRFSV